MIYIDITVDVVSELDEVFVLHLKDITKRAEGETAPEVILRRSVSTVVIRQTGNCHNAAS
jgi:hypothetical protein